MVESGCGLDVHQATVVACLLIVLKNGKVQKQVHKDEAFRAEFVERIGLGFELPKAETVEVVPNVPRIAVEVAVGNLL
jgi:hypothetical protein